MKRMLTAVFVAAALCAPGVARAGTAACPLGGVGHPFASSPINIVSVCANGQLFQFTGFIGNGKPFTLPTTTINLGNGASFTVSAAINADPFSSFTFGSIIPTGFGPFTFDAFFTTLLAPGSYNFASSIGTLGITTSGAAATGSVTNDGQPFYITGYGGTTNLGVSTGAGACTATTPPNPNAASCNPSGATKTFAPIGPSTLTARLNYTQNTTGAGGLSSVAFTGSVNLGNTAIVPEPATFGLVFGGMLLIGGASYRRKRA